MLYIQTLGKLKSTREVLKLPLEVTSVTITSLVPFYASPTPSPPPPGTMRHILTFFRPLPLGWLSCQMPQVGVIGMMMRQSHACLC